MRQGKIKILLVEDNDADCELTRRVMQKECRQPFHLEIVNNGYTALEFMHRRNEYANAVTPDLILLDLNLPLVDGWEVLADLKSNDELKHIPIVVFTTSTSPSDIMKAYRMHSNSYISKPLDINHFARVIRLLEEYWFSLVVLPE